VCDAKKSADQTAAARNQACLQMQHLFMSFLWEQMSGDPCYTLHIENKLAVEVATRAICWHNFFYLNALDDAEVACMCCSTCARVEYGVSKMSARKLPEHMQRCELAQTPAQPDTNDCSTSELAPAG